MATDSDQDPTHRIRWIVTHPTGHTELRDEEVIVLGVEDGQLVIRWADGFGNTSIAQGAILTCDPVHDPVVCDCGPAYEPLNAWGECATCHRKPLDQLDGGAR